MRIRSVLVRSAGPKTVEQSEVYRLKTVTPAKNPPHGSDHSLPQYSTSENTTA
jgi:hypothetical protein